MCGICGIVVSEEAPRAIDEGVLDRMTRAMQHRGPDARGKWISRSGLVGLGHQRLSIIDLSDLGRQPMTNEDSSVWIAFNGEIYNYQSLRADLIKKGHCFRSETDTEVLIHLYEEAGVGMLDQLDGDFAFALWDERKAELFVARDPVGVKPLYYVHQNGYFLFASEIKALLEHPVVEKAIDPEALYHYLTYLMSPYNLTLFKGIQKLAAGEAAVFTRKGTIRKWTYWEPLPHARQSGAGDLDEEFAHLFHASVEKRLMSNVPVGTLFSGGVDSTLNTVSYKELIEPERVRTYSVGMSAPRFAASGEGEFASRTADCIGTNHHHIQLTHQKLIDTLDNSDLTFFHDEPIGDPVCIPLYHVTRLARESGTVVLHAGEGADEIFCGYEKFLRFLRYERCLWRPLGLLPRWMASTASSATRKLPGHRLGKIADVLSRRGRGQEFYLSECVAFFEDEKQQFLSRDFRERTSDIDSFDVVRPLYDRLRQAYPNPSFLQTMTYLELRHRLPDLLLTRTDKIAMANSIEVRVPFLDKKLVEFAISAPESFKVRNGIAKEPVKRLGAAKLEKVRDKPVPRELGSGSADIFYRPKTGFGIPIQDWFGGKLGQRLKCLLHEDRHDIEAYFDVDRLLRRLSGPTATVNQAYQLWVIYAFLDWKRRFRL